MCTVFCRYYCILTFHSYLIRNGIFYHQLLLNVLISVVILSSTGFSVANNTGCSPSNKPISCKTGFPTTNYNPFQLVAAAVLAMVAAAPQNGNQLDYQARPYYRPLATLRNHRQDLGDGNFNYEFLTENGIHVGAQGTPGYRGQSNINGFYR